MLENVNQAAQILPVMYYSLSDKPLVVLKAETVPVTRNKIHSLWLPHVVYAINNKTDDG